MTTKKKYRDVVVFLIKFIGIYLIGNIAYGLFVEYYAPAPDPITIIVSENVASLLNLTGQQITLSHSSGSPYISFFNGDEIVINVFEGCNGLNVMIVYLAFLFAFSGGAKKTVYFLMLGLGVIYLANLARVLLLYEVALHFPSSLYFFHKYFFTGVLYLIVFILWYFWVQQTKVSERGTSTT